MRSNILHDFHFKDEVRREAASAEFSKRVGSGAPDLDPREEFRAYFRATGSQLRDELGEQSRWGGADTYDHTREPNKGMCNEKEKEMSRRLGGGVRNSISNYRCVNCEIATSGAKNLIMGKISTENGILLIN